MFIKTKAPQDALILQVLPMMTQACQILCEEFERYCSGAQFDVTHKADDSPVTQADYRVNQYITAELSRLFSNIPILSEEGEHVGREKWKTLWLLDPLDGTKEFLKQRAQFTINLSLVEQADTVFAVLAVPAEHCMYFCPKKGLPLKFDLKTQQWWQYTADQPQSILQVGLSHSAQQKGQYQAYLEALAALTEFEQVKAGSAYKFCLMLEGKVDLYPRFHPTSEWDTSAGQCLIERIGGGLVDFSAQPFVYNQRKTLLNGGFFAFKDAKSKELAFQAWAIIRSDD